MSSSLNWKPAMPPPPPAGSASQPLKCIIVRRFWDPYADGSLCYRNPRTMSFENDGAWLQGVIDGSNNQHLEDQALSLLADLRQYGTLEITVE